MRVVFNISKFRLNSFFSNISVALIVLRLRTMTSGINSLTRHFLAIANFGGQNSLSQLGLHGYRPDAIFDLVVFDGFMHFLY